jgi:hypothetical protein
MSWLDFVIAALVAFRVTRLVGWDEITLPLRTRVCGVTDEEYFGIAKFVDDVQERGKDPFDLDPRASPPLPIGKRRFYVAKLLHCPWCVGFWISVLVAVDAHILTSCSWHKTVLVAFALSAIVGLVAKNLDP